MHTHFRSVAIATGLLLLVWQLTSLANGEDSKARTAAQMMRTQHDARAVWDNFPGFRAKVRCANEGVVVEGEVTVDHTGEIELSLPQDEQFAWVKRSLDSLAGHRLPGGDAESNVEFADEQVNHPQGRLIKSLDPAAHALWRVKGDVLTEVHRISDKTRFIISVSEVTRNPEGKHLPRTFVVTTWDNATNRIESVRQVTNEFTRVGKFDLPIRVLAVTNRSDGTRVTQQIELSSHKLIPGVTAAR